jgi:hypothetical protein
MCLDLLLKHHTHLLLLASDVGTGLGSSSGDTFSDAVKKASNKAQIKDGTSVQGRLSACYYNFQSLVVCCFFA